jgi:DNA-binding NarL/FixJ family response regulator
MGSKKCLEELLDINPQARVVIASGFFPNGPTIETIEAGAEGFIGKPYDLKQMLQQVRRVLDAD